MYISTFHGRYLPWGWDVYHGAGPTSPQGGCLPPPWGERPQPRGRRPRPFSQCFVPGPSLSKKLRHEFNFYHCLQRNNCEALTLHLNQYQYLLLVLCHPVRGTLLPHSDSKWHYLLTSPPGQPATHPAQPHAQPPTHPSHGL